MGQDQILAPNTLADPTGGPVTGTNSNGKRGLDVTIIADSSGGASVSTTRLDEASSTITYVGKADIGTANSAASWQIQRIEVSGTVTTITFADGDDAFDNVWNDRASLTYL